MFFKSVLRKLRKFFFFYIISSKKTPSYTLIEKFRELVYLRELLEDLKITTVIDVGANEGQFAGDLRNIGFTKKIISFEPAGSPYAILESKVKKDKNWTCFQYALGKENKTMDFYVPDDTKLSSLLESDLVTTDSGHVETVEVKRLDEIIFSIFDSVDKEKFLLKIDTQGYDLEVFSGSKGILSRVEGLMSEVSVQPIYNNMVGYKEALAVYEKEGFKIFSLSIVARDHLKEVVELNCLMKRGRMQDEVSPVTLSQF
jgi:FkbM family methyltransferase